MTGRFELWMRSASRYIDADDRTIAYVMAALVEASLKAHLERVLQVEDPEALLRNIGADVSIATAARQAYELRRIDKALLDDIVLVTEIRRLFVVDYYVCAFEFPQITARCRELRLIDQWAVDDPDASTELYDPMPDEYVGPYRMRMQHSVAKLAEPRWRYALACLGIAELLHRTMPPLPKGRTLRNA